jgi:hypothetical protein
VKLRIENSNKSFSKAHDISAHSNYVTQKQEALDEAYCSQRVITSSVMLFGGPEPLDQRLIDKIKEYAFF